MSKTQEQTAELQTKVQKEVTAQVLAKVESFISSGELQVPKDYSVSNALKSAYLVLNDPKNNILEKCDKGSIAEALLKMVVYGVSPIKKQCYFIPYGQKLECSISYAGNIAIAKRLGGLKSIKGNAIFEGDTFEFEVDALTGRRKVTKHIQTLDSIGGQKLKGAYSVYEMNDGTIDVEVMNISQIQAAWNQGGSKGNSPAHKNFADQMAIKTVNNRACKLIISSSDDSYLQESEELESKTTVKEEVKQEIFNNANTETIEFDEVPAESEEVLENAPMEVDEETGELKF